MPHNSQNSYNNPIECDDIDDIQDLNLPDELDKQEVPSKIRVFLRACFGLIAPPIDALIGFGNDYLNSKSGVKSTNTFDSTRKWSRYGALLGFAIGLAVAFAVPVPGSTLLYVIGITACHIYIPSFGLRMLGAMFGGKDDYDKASKTDLIESNFARKREAKTRATLMIYTVLFGVEAAKKINERLEYDKNPDTYAPPIKKRNNNPPAPALEAKETLSDYLNRRRRMGDL